MGRPACGGGVWRQWQWQIRHEKDCGLEWRLNVRCESESEMCGVCRVGFSNLCFYSLISLVTYLYGLIIVS